jgi:nanoRNase/pAp phosphatase (c-di-AMP/oligoRNAs hydrolase)
MRLVTRSDFDGLICAVLLKQVEQIDEMKFVHPKDLQDGNFDVRPDDILTNVPYVPGCGLWFDHHSSEVHRVTTNFEYRGDCRIAPSAARVVYDYYGGVKTFGDIGELMSAVDKADSAQFTVDEILNPTRWDLLSFIMDARTGLGRFKDYRISNYQLMHDLVEACRTLNIDEIFELPDVAERTTRYFEQVPLFRRMLIERTTIHGNVIVTDIRGVDPIPAGNRFMTYALNPNENISIWIAAGKQGQNCVFACGHSSINRSSKVDIGEFMRCFGGGGHKQAGTCQVSHEAAEATLRAIIEAMNAVGSSIARAA